MNNTERFAIKKAASDFNLESLPALNAIADPLFKHTGLTHFAYNKFMQGDRYLALSSDRRTALNFLENELDRHLLFENLLIPKNSKRVVFWDQQKDNELLANLRSYNYSHGLSVFIRGENEIEAWHFATSIENPQMNQFYLNHPSVIDQFIMHFKEKAKDLICITDTTKLAIYSGNRTLDMNEAQGETEIQQLIELLSVKQMPFMVDGKNVSLSRREFEAVRGLSRGFSVKSIARELCLSPRTVEDYLNQAKIKLGVLSTEGLLKVMHESVYALLDK